MIERDRNTTNWKGGGEGGRRREDRKESWKMPPVLGLDLILIRKKTYPP